MEDLEKIKERIEFLDDKCDTLMEEFDNYWYGAGLNEYEPEDFTKNFEAYRHQKEASMGDAIIELRNLLREERMLRPIEYKEMPVHGDVMLLEDFKECVKCGCFIDYDGYGNYIKDGKCTNIEIYPSDIKRGSIREGFISIIWYNR